jgi:hypothetical protein
VGDSQDSSWQAHEILGEVRRQRKKLAELKDDFAKFSSEYAETKKTLDRITSIAQDTQRSINLLSAQYALERELQRARGRVAELTAEMDRRFGDRNRVRQLATALSGPIVVDALNAEVVEDRTLRNYCQELMLANPNYWLASAALSLAASYRGDTKLEAKAHRAAMSLDEPRTCLFMALTLSRAPGEENRAAVWLDNYLASVDPNALDDDFLVLLDAVAQGELGKSGWMHAEATLRKWRAETVLPHMTDAQVSTLKDLLTERADLPTHAYFPTLSRHTKEWDEAAAGLRLSLACGLAAKDLGGRFAHHLSPERPPGRARPGTPHVDSALNGLITHQDGDEAELQRELDRQRLILKCEGDTKRAASLDAARRQRSQGAMNVPALLVQAAFPTDDVRIGVHAQHMALACARDWINKAGEAVADDGWRRRPSHLTLRIYGWQAQLPTDPATPVDEVRLERSFREHLDQELRRRRRARITGTMLGIVIVLLLLAGAPRFIRAADHVLHSVGLLGLLFPVLALLLFLGAAATAAVKLSAKSRHSQQRYRSGAHGLDRAVAILRQALRERRELLAQWSLAHEEGPAALAMAMERLSGWSPMSNVRDCGDPPADIDAPDRHGEQRMPPVERGEERPARDGAALQPMDSVVDGADASVATPRPPSLREGDASKSLRRAESARGGVIGEAAGPPA